MPKTIELFDETINDNNEFVHSKVGEFTIEHSLLSISKWEMKYHKPYMSSEKSKEEVFDYITMMILDKDFNMNLLSYLSEENVREINDYIGDPMTATTFPEDAINRMMGTKNNKQDTITNELVYYWMSCAQIPFECEKWHINRLLTLIRVHDFYNKKNDKRNKPSKRDIMARNKALNDARRAKLHTRG